MRTLPFFQVDVFTERAFSSHPQGEASGRASLLTVAVQPVLRGELALGD